MKSYPAPWNGELLLACKRCQKKLRKSKASPDFARMRKWVKARLRRESGLASNPGLYIIEIPCQNICPKNGVVVLSQSQVAERPARFSIVSSESQMQEIYASTTRTACTTAFQGAHPPLETRETLN